jgi:hypothetical protein
MRTIKRIPSAGLEESLIVLPLASMLTLFAYFEKWLRDGVQVCRPSIYQASFYRPCC